MSFRRTIVALLAAGLTAGVTAAAQERPASPVRYTEAREQDVQRMVKLPGTVESRTVSLVASEVAGLVDELLVRDGDTVLQNQPLARLRTTNLKLQREAAAAQLKEAQARLKLAERNLERANEMLESKIISREDYDSRYYEFHAQQGRIEELTALVARLDDDLERSTIRAPFAGVVTAKRTEVGQWLAVGDPVVAMLSLDELEVRVDVPENYYRSLNPRARARVTFDALPGLTLTGRVTAIIPSANPEAHTFPIKVAVPNRQGRIGAGMLAQVSFPAGDSYRATVVPKDAVIRRGQQEFVYLMNGDDTVSLVPVETGTGVGLWVEVRGSVAVGQKVVTRGNERLQPGQKVSGQPLEYELP